jgi:hypothetical protein
MYDCVPHAIFWRQNVMTSVLLRVKQIDLGNGGARLPESFLKKKRLEILAAKQNSPQVM